HFQAQAALQDPIELRAFFDHDRVLRRQRRQAAAQFQQRRHTRGRVVGFERSYDLIGEFPDLHAAGDAGPGGVDAVHDVLLRRFTRQDLERLRPRAAATAAAEVAETLRLVHRATAAGEVAER